MILKTKSDDQIKSYKAYINEYFKEKFFIFPFKCPVCGNTYMFERGILSNRFCTINNYDYSMNDKICDICATPIRADIKKKLDYFEKTGQKMCFKDYLY